jgi:hypothetical protein
MKGRKTGGRKKGSMNKRTIAREAMVKAGIEPLEVMLANMRQAYDQALVAERALGDALFEPPPTGRKTKAAKSAAALLRTAAEGRAIAQACAGDAAPYCHARLASVTHKGDKDNPIEHRVEITDDDRAKALAVFLAKNKPAEKK